MSDYATCDRLNETITQDLLDQCYNTPGGAFDITNRTGSGYELFTFLSDLYKYPVDLDDINVIVNMYDRMQTILEEVVTCDDLNDFTRWMGYTIRLKLQGFDISCCVYIADIGLEMDKEKRELNETDLYDDISELTQDSCEEWESDEDEDDENLELTSMIRDLVDKLWVVRARFMNLTWLMITSPMFGFADLDEIGTHVENDFMYTLSEEKLWIDVYMECMKNTGPIGPLFNLTVEIQKEKPKSGKLLLDWFLSRPDPGFVEQICIWFSLKLDDVHTHKQLVNFVKGMATSWLLLFRSQDGKGVPVWMACESCFESPSWDTYHSPGDLNEDDIAVKRHLDDTFRWGLYLAQYEKHEA